MRLIRRIVTPSRVRGGAIGLFFASLATGMATNMALLVSMLRPAPTALPPPVPVPSVAPAPQRPAPMTHLREMPKSLGAAAIARRNQYENHISITQGGKTIALPVHTGTTDVHLGPLVLSVPAGTTVEWDPMSGLSGTTDVRLVFAYSDVPAEDATHAVVLWGTGEDAPAPGDKRELDPFAYIPEVLSLPLNVQNNTSRDARVTLEVWTNANPEVPDL